MIGNKAQSLSRGLNASFWRDYTFQMEQIGAAKMDPVAMMCSTFQARKKKQDHLIPGDPPGIQEWLDERKPQGFNLHEFTTESKKWEATIEIKLDDVEDDEYGVYTRMASGLGQRAARHRFEYLYETLEANPVGYDEVALFHDAHPALGNEGGTQDNLLAGTGITVDQIKADIRSAKTRMFSFKDEAGKILHTSILPSDLCAVIPPDLEFPFREVISAGLVSGGGTNVYAGAVCCYFVNPLLTDANDWYLCHCGTGADAKLLIWHDRIPLEVTTSFKTGDEAFDRDIVKWGTRARYGINAGRWQCGVKIVNG